MNVRHPSDEDLSAFGAAVEKWRCEHGITQTVLAGLIGTHRRTLNHWLRPDGAPGAVHQLARLALLMGSSIEELFAQDANLDLLRDPAFVENMVRGAAPLRDVRRHLERMSREAQRTKGRGSKRANEETT